MILEAFSNLNDCVTMSWSGQVFSKALSKTSFLSLKDESLFQNVTPTQVNTQRIWDYKLNGMNIELSLTLLQTSANEAGRLLF